MCADEQQHSRVLLLQFFEVCGSYIHNSYALLFLSGTSRLKETEVSR